VEILEIHFLDPEKILARLINICQLDYGHVVQNWRNWGRLETEDLLLFLFSESMGMIECKYL